MEASSRGFLAGEDDVLAAAHILALQFADQSHCSGVKETADSNNPVPVPAHMVDLVDSCLDVVSLAMTKSTERSKEAIKGLPMKAMVRLLQHMNLKVLKEQKGEDDGWQTFDVEGEHGDQKNFKTDDSLRNCVWHKEFSVYVSNAKVVGPFAVGLYPKGDGSSRPGCCTVVMRGPSGYVIHVEHVLKPKKYRSKSELQVYSLPLQCYAERSGRYGESCNIFINHVRDKDYVEYLKSKVQKLTRPPAAALLAHWASEIASKGGAKTCALEEILQLWNDFAAAAETDRTTWDVVFIAAFDEVFDASKSPWIKILNSDQPCPDIFRTQILKSLASGLDALTNEMLDRSLQLRQQDVLTIMKSRYKKEGDYLFSLFSSWSFLDTEVEKVWRFLLKWSGKFSAHEPEEESSVIAEKPIINQQSWFYKLVKFYEACDGRGLEGAMRTTVCDELKQDMAWIDLMNGGSEILTIWKTSRKTMAIVANFIMRGADNGAPVPDLVDRLAVSGLKVLIDFVTESGLVKDFHLLGPRLRAWIDIKLQNQLERNALEDLLTQIRSNSSNCSELYWHIYHAYVHCSKEESSSREREIKRLKTEVSVLGDKAYIVSLEDDRRKYEELKLALRSLPHMSI